MFGTSCDPLSMRESSKVFSKRTILQNRRVYMQSKFILILPDPTDRLTI